jgi:hypothetical protein
MIMSLFGSPKCFQVEHLCSVRVLGFKDVHKSVDKLTRWVFSFCAQGVFMQTRVSTTGTVERLGNAEALLSSIHSSPPPLSKRT